MKPVMQTIMDNKKGDCFRACVASIFELPIEEVPNFVDVPTDSKHGWWPAVIQFFVERGYYPLPFEIGDFTSGGWALPEGYQIISGESPRGNWDHAVVAKDGKIVHDPHPEGTGLDSKDECLVFVALDPSRSMK